MNMRNTLALSALLILIGYASVLKQMFGLWMTDEDLAHGILVLPVIAWIVYRERARLRELPLRSSWWGVPLLVAGCALNLASVRGAGIFLGSLALPVTVAGTVLCLGGFRWLGALTVPFLLSLLMLPKLDYFYNELTLPLQLIASGTAAGILTAGGFDVIRSGTLLTVGGHQVIVEAACNGIRYLYPLLFVIVVFGYIARSRLWIRAALCLLAIPLAIVANAFRVAASAASPRLATGDWHTITGVVMFVVILPVLPFAQAAFQAIDRRIRVQHA
jgi:exosortase